MKVPHSNSRENQDLIVACLFNGKQAGTYLEVGASQPIEDSNTYLLEQDFNWYGVSLEIDAGISSSFNNVRKNKCICADATTVDYTNIIETNFSNSHIDFLQLDIDPSYNTLKALKKIDFNKFTFSFITFEHDLYREDVSIRDESRQILESSGYTRMLSDVSHAGKPFEDWYINKRTIELDNWKMFVGENINMNSADMPDHIKRIINDIISGI